MELLFPKINHNTNQYTRPMKEEASSFFGTILHEQQSFKREENDFKIMNTNHNFSKKENSIVFSLLKQIQDSIRSILKHNDTIAGELDELVQLLEKWMNQYVDLDNDITQEQMLAKSQKENLEQLSIQIENLL